MGPEVTFEPIPIVLVAAWAVASIVLALFLAQRRPGARVALRAALSLFVVSGALGLLARAELQPGAEYYKDVDEVTANMAAWRGKRLQVHGCLVARSLERATGILTKCPSKYDAGAAPYDCAQGPR